jgi:glycosyl transferase family 2
MEAIATHALPISVVIASWSGEQAMSRCLESLMPQSAGAEVIVATNGPSEMAARLEARYPAVRFLRASHNATVFQLRALGAAEACGRLIAHLEDHTTVGPQWRDALCSAHAEGHSISGGPVDNGLTDRAYDWALYFCEYGIYMPPLPRGEAQMLSGLNVAYDREVLGSCREIWRDALYETDVHGALQAAGQKLYLAPEAWTKSHLEMSLGRAIIHLFGGGRHFGAFRKARSSALARVLWVLASPLVPLVFLLRIIRGVARRDPSRLKHVLRGLPYLLLLLGAWGAGEAAGYLGRTSSRTTPKPLEETSYADRH